MMPGARCLHAYYTYAGRSSSIRAEGAAAMAKCKLDCTETRDIVALNVPLWRGGRQTTPTPPPPPHPSRHVYPGRALRRSLRAPLSRTGATDHGERAAGCGVSESGMRAGAEYTWPNPARH